MQIETKNHRNILDGDEFDEHEREREEEATILFANIVCTYIYGEQMVLFYLFKMASERWRGREELNGECMHNAKIILM